MKKRENAVDAAAFIGKKVRKLGKKFEKQGLGRASQVEINTPGHGGSFNQIPDKAQGLIDFRLLGENTPDRVLEEFEKIRQKVAKKTKTQIDVQVVSSGTPVITSSNLNENLEFICKQNGIPYLEMPSFAGQDTGYVPAKEKTMIFIPSKGGSHNPKESTKREYIEMAEKVFEKASLELLRENFKEKQAVNIYSSKVQGKGREVEKGERSK